MTNRDTEIARIIARMFAIDRELSSPRLTDYARPELLRERGSLARELREWTQETA